MGISHDENKGYPKDFETVADLPKYGDMIHDEPGTTYRE